MSVFVGQRWNGELGGQTLVWRVIWVGKKKARLKAQVEFGWAEATVFIDRLLDSPNWEPHDT